MIRGLILLALAGNLSFGLQKDVAIRHHMTKAANIVHLSTLIETQNCTVSTNGKAEIPLRLDYVSYDGLVLGLNQIEPAKALSLHNYPMHPGQLRGAVSQLIRKQVDFKDLIEVAASIQFDRTGKPSGLLLQMLTVLEPADGQIQTPTTQTVLPIADVEAGFKVKLSIPDYSKATVEFQCDSAKAGPRKSLRGKEWQQEELLRRGEVVVAQAH